MPQKNISLGTPGEQNGDFVRNAMSKTEDNFTELYYNTGGVVDTSANWITGMTFSVIANLYPAGNGWHSAIAANVTHDIGGAEDRIDIITANTDRTISIIKGVLTGAAIAEPNYDAETQYPVKFVLIKAGATTPNGYLDNLILNEGIGLPTEWDYITGPNDELSTDDFHLGAKSIEGSATVLDRATLTTGTSVITSEINTFSFWVKLKEAYGKEGFINVYFSNVVNKIVGVPTPLPEYVHVTDGLYGFSADSVVWQKIVIGIDGTSINLPSINKIEISPRKSGGSTGWYIDEAIIQTHTAIVSPPTPHPSNTSAFTNDGEGRVDDNGDPLKFLDETFSPFKNETSGTPNIDSTAPAYRTGNTGFGKENPVEKVDILGSTKSEYIYANGAIGRTAFGGINLNTEDGAAADALHGILAAFTAKTGSADRTAGMRPTFFAGDLFPAGTNGLQVALLGIQNILQNSAARVETARSVSNPNTFLTGLFVKEAVIPATNNTIGWCRMYKEGFGAGYEREPLFHTKAENTKTGDKGEVFGTPHEIEFTHGLLKASFYGQGTRKEGFSNTDTVAATDTAPTVIGAPTVNLSFDTEGILVETKLVYTFANLPTGNAGMRTSISDSTRAFTSAEYGELAAGGSTNFAPVTHDGTAWRIG
jgi:hypothetical protein